MLNRQKHIFASMFQYAISVFLAAISITPSFAQTYAIDWEVVDRFRVLNNASDLDFLARRINDLLTEESNSIAQPLKNHQHRSELDLRPLPTQWNPHTARYEAGWAQATQWQIKFSVRPQPEVAASCTWIIGSTPYANQPCTQWQAPAPIKQGTLVTARWLNTSAQPLEASWLVKVQDHLIVLLGDSYGAGEGYPDVASRTVTLPMADEQGNTLHHRLAAQWWDQRCHRSLFSGGAMAAIRYAHSHPQHSVTFLSYACSGAKISDKSADGGGILTPYHGIQPLNIMQRIKQDARVKTGRDWDYQVSNGAPALVPQLEAALRDLCVGEFDSDQKRCNGTVLQPDLVILSIGGNDIGFGRIIANMVAPRLGQCTKECIQSMIGERFETLPQKYDQLAQALAQNLNPKRVALMEYPNPTGHEQTAPNANMEFCDDIKYKRDAIHLPLLTRLGVISITHAEYQATYEQVYQPLILAVNEAVKRNRAPYHWTLMPPLSQDSASKGLCADKRWINDVDISTLRQGALPTFPLPKPAGGFHPNFFGYYNYAVRLEDYFNRIFK